MESETKAKQGSSYDGTTVDPHKNLVTLPDHLIVELILPRLPLNSLRRFKSVCLLWHFSICSAPTFAKTHLKSSSLCPQFFIVKSSCAIHDICNFFLLSYDKCSNNVKNLAELDMKTHRSRLKLVGVCNDLVCFNKREYPGNVFLYTPATRQCRKIIRPYGSGIEYVWSYGFGYVSSIDDYKIIVTSYTGYNQEVQFNMFSLRAGNWGRIHSLGKYILLPLQEPSVVINDVLYWPFFCLRHYRFADHFIGFNLVSEQVEKRPWMNWLNEYRRVRPLQFQECLSLSCEKDTCVYDLWMLKKHDDWNSWQKLLSVGPEGSHYFSEIGKCLVESSDSFKLGDFLQEAVDRIHMNSFSDTGQLEAGDYVEESQIVVWKTKLNQLCEAGEELASLTI